MRIAILTNAYPPDARGGAGQIAFLQTEGLRARGHEVRVWHVPAVWTRTPAFVRLCYHVRDLVRVDPCVKEILAWNPEYVMSHNLTGVGFRTPGTIQKQGIRWIHVLHDVQLFEPSGRLMQWPLVTAWQRLWSRLRQSVFGMPDLVVSPTQTLLDAHLRRGFFVAAKTAVIPNPAPRACFSPRTRHTPRRVLFVGRWSEDKGSALLSALWSRSALSSLEWILLGPGTENSSPPRGQGYGRCLPEKILEYMQRVDVLVVPSQIMENQPTVLLEAMSRGLPVIASRQAGIEETLGGVGIVADTLSEWERALLSLLQEEDESYAVRVQAMQAAWLRYDPERIFQRIEEVLVTLN